MGYILIDRKWLVVCSVVIVALLVTIFYKGDEIMETVSSPVLDSAIEEAPPDVETPDTDTDPWMKSRKRIKKIRALCGDLCDTNKTITPGDFLGTVTAKVDCKKLFQSPDLYEPADMPAPTWGMFPPDLKELYTYNGRIEYTEWWFEEAHLGAARTEPEVFTKEQVEYFINQWLAGTAVDTYANGSNIVAAAADYVDVAGKTILVMGTQNPWLEAVLLFKKAKKVVTLEYGYFISEYPGYSFIQPKEFRERFLNGTLDEFDVVFSYSSLEHSGQGRYGDALNPWGDIMAVAQAWCVTKKDAVFAMGINSMVSYGKDMNVFNAHKHYGPLTYPFLMTNWKFTWPTRVELREDKNTEFHLDDHNGYQPVYVFEKNHGGFWG